MSFIFGVFVLMVNTALARDPGEYVFRLEKWNSGKLFVSENNGFYLSKFGTVCRSGL